MTTRYRFNSSYLPVTGNYWRRLADPQDVEITEQNALVQQSWDEVGDWHEVNPLTLTSWQKSFCTLDGEWYYYGSHEATLTHVPMTYHPSPPDPIGIFGPITAIEQNNYAWDILARTNPSVPHVSIPTFIGELKDLPYLVKGWGGSLLKKVAQGHLSWRWAIKPMISDIRKMADFAEAVNRRIQWLEKLRTSTYLSRRTGLGSSEVFVQGGLKWLHSHGCKIIGSAGFLYTSKVWGTAQWKLDSGASLPATCVGLRKLAYRLTHGITSYESANTAWELLPWSWFVDWFAGLGTIIAAGNNTLPLTWSMLSLMRTMTCKVKYEIDWSHTLTSDWVSSSGIQHAVFTRKERLPVAPILPFTPSLSPLVDGDKWSILGSLAALRWSR